MNFNKFTITFALLATITLAASPATAIVGGPAGPDPAPFNSSIASPNATTAPPGAMLQAQAINPPAATDDCPTIANGNETITAGYHADGRLYTTEVPFSVFNPCN